MEKDTILVVDDNAVNMKLIRILLTGEGYEVRTAADAKEAAEVLAEIHPCLILMDIQLPGIDGLELTRRLKAEPTTREITIVGLTAYAMKADEERILAARCDGYLAKPIDRSIPEPCPIALRVTWHEDRHLLSSDGSERRCVCSSEGAPQRCKASSRQRVSPRVRNDWNIWRGSD